MNIKIINCYDYTINKNKMLIESDHCECAYLRMRKSHIYDVATFRMLFNRYIPSFYRMHKS